MSKANLKGPFLYPSPSFVSLWQVVLSAIGAAISPACSIVQCSYSLLSLPDADTDHRRHHHRRPFTLIAFFAPPLSKLVSVSWGSALTTFAVAVTLLLLFAPLPFLPLLLVDPSTLV